MAQAENSYKQIIKSTSIFGGSQVITIIIGIIRNKLIAIILGVAGVGLIGIYQSILDMIRSVSTLGIETSGVRSVSQSAEDPDTKTLNKKIATVDFWTIVLAVASSLICLALSSPISHYFFKDSLHTSSIKALSVSLFFMVMAAGQTVVLQSLRKISYMVKSAIIWNFTGLVICIPLYFIFKEDGIVPVFILTSIGMYYSALYYRRKLRIPKIRLTAQDAKIGGKELFKLGFFIAAASVPSTASLFIVRAFLSNNLGIEAVGIFQAAWIITNTYLSLILKSMGTDFYPRLCTTIKDNKITTRLINEQTYIALILSCPAIIGILLFSDNIITLLYSKSFVETSTILHWQVAGTFLKVLSWPLGFILLAKGKGLLFFVTEIIYLIVYLICIKILYPAFGIEATGISYLISYIIYLPMVLITGKILSKFSWNKQNIKYIILSLILIIPALSIVVYNPNYKWITVTPLLLISIIVSTIRFNKVFPIKDILHKKKT